MTPAFNPLLWRAVLQDHPCFKRNVKRNVTFIIHFGKMWRCPVLARMKENMLFLSLCSEIAIKFWCIPSRSAWTWIALEWTSFSIRWLHKVSALICSQRSRCKFYSPKTSQIQGFSAFRKCAEWSASSQQATSIFDVESEKLISKGFQPFIVAQMITCGLALKWLHKWVVGMKCWLWPPEAL